MVDMNDTIVAIATAPGRGGIGIVRVSGPSAKKIADGMITKQLIPRLATYCSFTDTSNSVIDSGIALFFPGPASYTGEDVLELHGHGGMTVLSMLVDRALELGGRHARPGEFTERAFLNGKLDLLQAEAVADLIDSVSTQAARSAMRSLEGVFSNKLQVLFDGIVQLRAYIEGELDFSEEEIEGLGSSAVQQQLKEYLDGLNEILKQAEKGARLREGAQVIILGRPNVGKSSLLNQLVGRDTAIVTGNPGTTRDMVAEDILVEGIPLRIIDTAGLRDTDNEVEQEGIKRAKNTTINSDVILFVIEFDQTVSNEEKAMLEKESESKHIAIIRNKIDLAGTDPGMEKYKDGFVELFLSAKTGEGINLLLEYLKDYLGASNLREDTFVARTRHLEALAGVKYYLENCVTLCDIDNRVLVAEELRLAQERLGSITGEFVADDLLGEIFSRFCIGK